MRKKIYFGFLMTLFFSCVKKDIVPENEILLVKTHFDKNNNKIEVDSTKFLFDNKNRIIQSKQSIFSVSDKVFYRNIKLINYKDETAILSINSNLVGTIKFDNQNRPTEILRENGELEKYEYDSEGYLLNSKYKTTLTNFETTNNNIKRISYFDSLISFGFEYNDILPNMGFTNPFSNDLYFYLIFNGLGDLYLLQHSTKRYSNLVKSYGSGFQNEFIKIDYTFGLNNKVNKIVKIDTFNKDKTEIEIFYN